MPQTNPPQKPRLSPEATVSAPESSEVPSSNRPDKWFSVWKLLLLLLGLMVALYPQVFFHGHVFFYRDAQIFNYPLAFHHRDSLLHGEIPLWNPLNNCGIPFLAQWNNMVLYPLSFIYVIFPAPWSITFFTLAHLLLAGAGMYFLARRWTGSPLAAAVAGLAFAWNGITLHSLMWPNSCASLGWAPWVLLLTEMAVKEGGRKVLFAALVGAVQLLAGVPEIIAVTWIVGAGIAFISIREQKKQWKSATGRFAAIILLVTGLTAAQMLPFFDLLAHSQRSTSTGADSHWAMPSWGLANFFVPLFHTSPSFLNVWIQQEQQWTSSYYFGVGIMALAVVAVWRVREARLGWLLLVTGVGIVFALGKNGGVYDWVQQVLPVLGFLRYPIKWVQLAMFSLPLMAAFGIAALQNRSQENAGSSRTHLTVIGTAMIALIAIIVLVAKFYPHAEDSWPMTWQNGLARGIFLVLSLGAIYQWTVLPTGLSKHVCAGLVLIFLGLDISTHAPPQNPTVPGSEYGPVKLTMSTIPRFGQGRAMLTPEVQIKMRRAGSTNTVEDFKGKRWCLYQDVNLFDHIPKVNGLFSLYIKEEAEMEQQFYEQGNISAGLLDFLGVEQISARKGLFGWQPRESAMPMVTIGQHPIFSDPAGTILGLTSDRFDGSKVVYLPQEAEQYVSARGFVQGAKWRVTDLWPHRITAEYESPNPTMMVVSQTYYHPWSAYVDNQPTRIWRANYAYQAIEVPPGKHEVRFVYEDRIFYLGAFISIGTLIACAIFWVRFKTAPGDDKKRKA